MYLDVRKLFKNGRERYGGGARVVLSGVIIRFDLAPEERGFPEPAVDHLPVEHVLGG